MWYKRGDVVNEVGKGREIFRALDLGHVLLWSNGCDGF
jgi:hypothetical protein